MSFFAANRVLCRAAEGLEDETLEDRALLGAVAGNSLTADEGRAFLDGVPMAAVVVVGMNSRKVGSELMLRFKAIRTAAVMKRELFSAMMWRTRLSFDRVQAHSGKDKCSRDAVDECTTGSRRNRFGSQLPARVVARMMEENE